MKTTTKTLIFSIALIPAIMLVSSFAKPSTETIYATMRTFEAAKGSSSKIILTYEGKTKEIDLGNLYFKNVTPNTLKINQAINILASKCYESVTQSGGDHISM